MEWTIHHGDALEVLQDLSEGLAQTCVTSPPYWGLRDYGVDGQIGLEDELRSYVERLCDVFDEVKRVLRDDGTLWLNLGDCYAGTGRSGGGEQGDRCDKYGADARSGKGTWQAPPDKLKPKDLCMMPSRVAMELQRRGWYLRSRIVWHKPSTMPESVKDRPTSAHEYIFLLSPSEQYFYDIDAIREPVKSESLSRANRGRDGGHKWEDVDGQSTHSINEPGDKMGGTHVEGKNKRDVWSVNPAAFPDAHFAVYPEELIEPCVLAGTSEAGQCAECGAPLEREVSVERNVKCERNRDRYDVDGIDGNESGIRSLSGDRYNVNRQTTSWRLVCDCDANTEPQTVLDPFCGAGTTGVVAARHGRDFVGVELNEDYIDMANERIAEALEAQGDLTAAQADAHLDGRAGQLGLEIDAD